MIKFEFKNEQYYYTIFIAINNHYQKVLDKHVI